MRSAEEKGASAPEKKRDEPPKSRKSRAIPDSALASRVAAIFRRPHGSPWDKADLNALETLGTPDEEDLAVVERYYAQHWPPGADNALRRSVATFLKNFRGEVDRARAFFEGEAKAIREPARGEYAKPFNPPPQRPAHLA